MTRSNAYDIFKRLVFVNDIGDQFRIRSGAIVPQTFDSDNQIWGPFDNEKREPPTFAHEKGSHHLPPVFIKLRMLRLVPPLLPAVRFA
jgi:hypothetical protein